MWVLFVVDGVGKMINGAAVILIILWIVLIEVNILAYNNIRNEQKRFDEIICSVNREISMLHEKISLLNTTNLVQNKPELMDLLKTTEKRATIRKSDKRIKER